MGLTPTQSAKRNVLCSVPRFGSKHQFALSHQEANSVPKTKKGIFHAKNAFIEVSVAVPTWAQTTNWPAKMLPLWQQ